MKTFDEIVKERDWIGRQVEYMEKLVSYYSGKLHYESELEISKQALTQLRVKLAIAEAAQHTHED